jgi:hypothetical protein
MEMLSLKKRVGFYQKNGIEMITAALTFGYEKQIKTMCSVSEMEQEKRNTVPLFHFSRITSNPKWNRTKAETKNGRMRNLRKA